jgi:hypothetical protein
MQIKMMKKNVDVDLLGIIAVPYDDGQYSVHTNYAKAWNLIGYTDNQISGIIQYLLKMLEIWIMQQFYLKQKVLEDGISDYLDDTIAFASFAMSKTNPNALEMLGSPDSEIGTSVWLGVNAPCPISPDDSRIGFEWNQGSKYWRSMTYGEDTYAGSKIATRGQAWEVYRNQKLTDALSFGVSYVLYAI